MDEKISGKLLIVDDEEDIRQVIATYAAQIGLETVEAGNGENALELVKNGGFDVVVCDLVMPKMGGIGLLRSMRECGYYMPFIVLTGYASKESAIEALKLGALDYLEKPFVGEDLKRALFWAFKMNSEQKRFASQYHEAANRIGQKPAKGDKARIEAEILKMRSFRLGHEGWIDKAVYTSLDENDKTGILALFAAEASTQLLFCELALDSILQPEDDLSFNMEMAFLRATAQAIQTNAKQLEAENIFNVSELMTECYSMIRVFPQRIDENAVKVLKDATRYLRAEVCSFGLDNVSLEKTAPVINEQLLKLKCVMEQR